MHFLTEVMKLHLLCVYVCVYFIDFYILHLTDFKEIYR